MNTQEIVEAGSGNGGEVHVQRWTPPSDATQLFGILAQVATDPNADIAKLERIEAMYVRLKEREAKAAFDNALAEMQAELPVIDRKGKITIKDKSDKVIQSTPFARWEDVNEAITPILSKHGFALRHNHGIVPGAPEQGGGRIFITSILAARGHREETTIHLPHDATGSKNAVQAIGSSAAYGKRYNTLALLNLTTRGEDDDGKTGGTTTTTINDAQLGELRALIVETNTPIARVCEFAQVDRLEDIAVTAVDLVKSVIRQRAKKAAAVPKSEEVQS